MKIEYRTKEGYVGIIDTNDVCSFYIKENTFNIIRRTYGYDEYDWYEEEINGITDLRII